MAMEDGALTSLGFVGVGNCLRLGMRSAQARRAAGRGSGVAAGWRPKVVLSPRNSEKAAALAAEFPGIARLLVDACASVVVPVLPR